MKHTTRSSGTLRKDQGKRVRGRAYRTDPRAACWGTRKSVVGRHPWALNSQYQSKDPVQGTDLYSAPPVPGMWGPPVPPLVVCFPSSEGPL